MATCKIYLNPTYNKILTDSFTFDELKAKGATVEKNLDNSVTISVDNKEDLIDLFKPLVNKISKRRTSIPIKFKNKIEKLESSTDINSFLNTLFDTQEDLDALEFIEFRTPYQITKNFRSRLDRLNKRLDSILTNTTFEKLDEYTKQEITDFVYNIKDAYDSILLSRGLEPNTRFEQDYAAILNRINIGVKTGAYKPNNLPFVQIVTGREDSFPDIVSAIEPSNSTIMFYEMPDETIHTSDKVEALNQLIKETGQYYIEVENEFGLGMYEFYKDGELIGTYDVINPNFYRGITKAINPKLDGELQVLNSTQDFTKLIVSPAAKQNKRITDILEILKTNPAALKDKLRVRVTDRVAVQANRATQNVSGFELETFESTKKQQYLSTTPDGEVRTVVSKHRVKDVDMMLYLEDEDGITHLGDFENLNYALVDSDNNRRVLSEDDLLNGLKSGSLGDLFGLAKGNAIVKFSELSDAEKLTIIQDLETAARIKQVLLDAYDGDTEVNLPIKDLGIDYTLSAPSLVSLPEGSKGLDFNSSALAEFKTQSGIPFIMIGNTFFNPNNEDVLTQLFDKAKSKGWKGSKFDLQAHINKLVENRLQESKNRSFHIGFTNDGRILTFNIGSKKLSNDYNSEYVKEVKTELENQLDTITNAATTNLERLWNSVQDEYAQAPEGRKAEIVDEINSEIYNKIKQLPLYNFIIQQGSDFTELKLDRDVVDSYAGKGFVFTNGLPTIKIKLYGKNKSDDSTVNLTFTDKGVKKYSKMFLDLMSLNNIGKLSIGYSNEKNDAGEFVDTNFLQHHTVLTTPTLYTQNIKFSYNPASIENLDEDLFEPNVDNITNASIDLTDASPNATTTSNSSAKDLLDDNEEDFDEFSMFEILESEKTPHISKKQALDNIRRIVGEVEVGDLDRLLDKMQDGVAGYAAAAYFNKILYLRNTVAADTEYHEAFHIVLDTRMSTPEQNFYLSRAIEEINKTNPESLTDVSLVKFAKSRGQRMSKQTATKIVAEEYLANAFKQYVKDRKLVFGNLFNALFTRLMDFVNLITNKRTDLETLFNRINKGVYKNKSESNYSGDNIDTPTNVIKFELLKKSNNLKSTYFSSQAVDQLIKTLAITLKVKDINMEDFDNEFNNHILSFAQEFKNSIPYIQRALDKQLTYSVRTYFQNQLEMFSILDVNNIDAETYNTNLEIMKSAVREKLNVVIKEKADENDDLIENNISIDEDMDGSNITIELDEAKEGVKSRFDVTFDTINPASKLSKSMKDWISLSYEEINVEENGVIRTFYKTVDENVIYNSLLKILAGVAPQDILKTVKAWSISDPSISVFWKYIQKEFELTNDGVNIKVGNPSKTLFYNEFIRAFNKEHLLFLETVQNTEDTFTVNAARQSFVDDLMNDAQFVFNETLDSYISSPNTEVVVKELENDIIVINNFNEYLKYVGKVKFNVLEREIKNITETINKYIPLSENYIRYALYNRLYYLEQNKDKDDVNTYLDQDRINFLNSIKFLNVKPFDKMVSEKLQESLLQLSIDKRENKVSDKGANAYSIYTRSDSSPFEVSTRLKSVIDINYNFDLNKAPLSIQTADKKTRYSITEKSFMSRKYRQIQQESVSGILWEKNRLNYLENFKNIVETGGWAVTAGVRLNENDGNVFQKLSDEEYLKHNFSLFVQNFNVSTQVEKGKTVVKYDGKRPNTAWYTITQAEAGSTNHVVELPYQDFRNVENAKEALYAIIKSDINRVIENNAYIDKVNTNLQNSTETENPMIDGVHFVGIDDASGFKQYLKTNNGKIAKGLTLVQKDLLGAEISTALTNSVLSGTISNIEDFTQDFFNENYWPVIKSKLEEYVKMEVSLFDAAFPNTNFSRVDKRVTAVYGIKGKEEFITDLMLNHFVFSGSYMELVSGDLRSFKDITRDLYKRTRVLNAAGSEMVGGKYKVVSDITETVDENIPMIGGEKVVITDGQTRSNTIQAMKFLHKKGVLDTKSFDILLKVMRGNPTTFEDRKHLERFHNTAQSFKIVVHGETSVNDTSYLKYIKTSTDFINRVDTSILKPGITEEQKNQVYDQIDNVLKQYVRGLITEEQYENATKNLWDLAHSMWTAKPSKVKDFLMLNEMEANNISFMVPPSTSKAATLEMGSVGRIEDTEISLQVETHSTETHITKATQLLHVLWAELDDNEMVGTSGKTVKELKTAWRDKLANIFNNSFQNHLNYLDSKLAQARIDAIEKGESVEKINDLEKDFKIEWSRMAEKMKTSLENSNQDPELVKWFSELDENNEPRHLYDAPHTFKQFVQQILAGFSRDIYSQTSPGSAFIHVSSDTYNVIETEDGNVVKLSDQNFDILGNFQAEPNGVYYNSFEDLYTELRDNDLISNNTFEFYAYGRKYKFRPLGVKQETVDGETFEYFEMVIPKKFEHDFVETILETNPEFYQSISYRIPLQDKHSINYGRIIDLMDAVSGDIVVAPKEVQIRSGSDFDVDKLPMQLPVVNKITKINNNQINQSFVLANNKEFEYELYLKWALNSKVYRQAVKEAKTKLRDVNYRTVETLMNLYLQDMADIEKMDDNNPDKTMLMENVLNEIDKLTEIEETHGKTYLIQVDRQKISPTEILKSIGLPYTKESFNKYVKIFGNPNIDAAKNELLNLEILLMNRQSIRDIKYTPATVDSHNNMKDFVLKVKSKLYNIDASNMTLWNSLFFKKERFRSMSVGKSNIGIFAVTNAIVNYLNQGNVKLDDVYFETLGLPTINGIVFDKIKYLDVNDTKLQELVDRVEFNNEAMAIKVGVPYVKKTTLVRSPDAMSTNISSATDNGKLDVANILNYSEHLVGVVGAMTALGIPEQVILAIMTNPAVYRLNNRFNLSGAKSIEDRTAIYKLYKKDKSSEITVADIFGNNEKSETKLVNFIKVMDLIANDMREINTLYSLNKGLPADLNSLERLEASMAAYKIRVKNLINNKSPKKLLAINSFDVGKVLKGDKLLMSQLENYGRMKQIFDQLFIISQPEVSKVIGEVQEELNKVNYKTLIEHLNTGLYVQNFLDKKGLNNILFQGAVLSNATSESVENHLKAIKGVVKNNAFLKRLATEKKFGLSRGSKQSYLSKVKTNTRIKNDLMEKVRESLEVLWMTEVEYTLDNEVYTSRDFIKVLFNYLMVKDGGQYINGSFIGLFNNFVFEEFNKASLELKKSKNYTQYLDYLKDSYILYTGAFNFIDSVLSMDENDLVKIEARYAADFGVLTENGFEPLKYIVDFTGRKFELIYTELVKKDDITKELSIEETKNFITNSFVNVDEKEAKKLYRKFAKDYHPDKGGSEVLMKHLNTVNEKYKDGTLLQLVEITGENSIDPRLDKNLTYKLISIVKSPVNVASVKDKTLRDVLSAQDVLNEKSKIIEDEMFYMFEEKKFDNPNNKILIQEDKIILYNRVGYNEDVFKYTFEKLSYDLTPELKYILGLSTKEDLAFDLKKNCNAII